MSEGKKRLGFTAVGVVLLVASLSRGNDLRVANVALENSGEGYTHILADVSWKNSWRASWTETGVTPNVTVTNWDAAWVFIKYRVMTNDLAPWAHATLSTNNSDHTVPAQAMFKVGTSSNAVSLAAGVGGFLYRAGDGSGNWTNRLKLRWNYALDGVKKTDQVQVSVHAVEMVYVPQGAFFVGDGATSGVHGQFCSNTTATVAFRVTSEAELTLGGGGEGSLGNNNATGMQTKDDFSNTVSRTLPAEFPKGYNAFYCMKHELTQGQYVEFLNKLTRPQQNGRTASQTANYYALANNASIQYRNVIRCPATIPGTGTNIVFGCDANGNGIFSESDDGTDRACNLLSCADGMAYADWAGLRPMTELEFEKTCRGAAATKANEYAHGDSTRISVNAKIDVTYPEDGTETNMTDVSSGALVFNGNYIQTNGVNAGQGPVRVGLFATAGSNRKMSGSGYWGNMELSGNVGEIVVSVGHADGRSFVGDHGDGVLASSNGDANTATWPGSGASGTGRRGASWNSTAEETRVSDRFQAAYISTIRSSITGFRAVRSAPAGE